MDGARPHLHGTVETLAQEVTLVEELAREPAHERLEQRVVRVDLGKRPLDLDAHEVLEVALGQLEPAQVQIAIARHESVR